MIDYCTTHDTAELTEKQLSYCLHNISTTFRLVGLLNVEILKQSLNEIVQRHETLRTTFTIIDELKGTITAPYLSLTLPVVDWRQLSQEEQLIEVLLLATEEVQQPFYLINKPLLRATLLQIDEQEHVLLIVMHHIINSNWSTEEFIKEIATLYEASSIKSLSFTHIFSV
ncbi:amino acid adenylation domain-containing protein [Calothrix sp. NIES-4071]|nr:amino acid adenylation domain-containing protein [Calothrix sp. NIES-4071]BAZ60468.1 amino acid adenylation domain-containing protein [Calothrix sp. NIES-4105]